MKYDKIYHGIRLGKIDPEHPEKTVRRIEQDCIADGLNFMSIEGVNYFSYKDIGIDKQWFVDRAKFLADNNIYFGMSATIPHWEDNEEIVRAMKEVAGDHFLCIYAESESGTRWCAVGSEYPSVFGEEFKKYETPTATNLIEALQPLKDFRDEQYAIASFNGRLSKDEIAFTNCEATAIMPYTTDEKTSFPMLETWPGNPEFMVPLTRSVAKTNHASMWGTYIAHEWYAGTRPWDSLKRRRLKMGYDYAYMCGSHLFILESGDQYVFAHNPAQDDNYNTESGVVTNNQCLYGHPLCSDYRQALKDFSAFIKQDKRPAGGPKVKVAFVQGNLDGYSPWRAGSSIFNMFGKKAYGYSAPEYSWRIIDDIATKRTWGDMHNYGAVDLSGAPAYGQYDIIQATADYDVLSKYDYLIFVGWNTMTDSIYENLKKFVQGGGKLFMTAAHLNTSIDRASEIKLYKDGKVADLFGCDLDPKNVLNINHGFKFHESIVPGVMLPSSMYFDPLMSEGYANYAPVTLKGASPTGKLSQGFSDREPDAMPVWLTEYKCGEGYAMLLTSLDYPSGATYMPYRTIVRELMTASHREADVKIYGGDKLRFAVYEGNKIYLLNTDFDCRTDAIIDYGNEKKRYLLEPMEFKVIEPNE